MSTVFEAEEPINIVMIEEYTALITDHGFPVVSALAGGYFIFLTIKFILRGVTENIRGLKANIQALERRITVMNNDMKRIDIAVSRVLGVEADLDTISRSEPDDRRKD